MVKPSEANIDKIMIVMNSWFNHMLKIDRNSNLVAELAALLPEAPATADKLRMAVEALEKIADEAPYRSGYCQSDIEYGPKLSDTEMQAEARQALAALNEQPQKPST